MFYKFGYLGFWVATFDAVPDIVIGFLEGGEEGFGGIVYYGEEDLGYELGHSGGDGFSMMARDIELE